VLKVWIYLLVFILTSCRTYYQVYAAEPVYRQTIQVTNDTPISDDASQVYSYVNLARANGGVCGNTYFPPAPTLYYDAILERVALKHSQDMQAAQQMTHVTPVGAINYPAGSRLRDRINQEGYTWRMIGENVAWNYPSAKDVVEAWLASPDHCVNILSAEFTHIGVGKSGEYWTQEFALPGGQ
jgi:uncharacterized protein YkwD